MLEIEELRNYSDMMEIHSGHFPQMALKVGCYYPPVALILMIILIFLTYSFLLEYLGNGKR